MKPSGAGFVGHVHVRSSSTFCATATQDRRRACELRRGLARVEPNVVHAFIRPLRDRAAERGVAIFARHGYDAVAVRIMKRLLIFGPLVLGLFHSVRPPPSTTAERHGYRR